MPGFSYHGVTVHFVVRTILEPHQTPTTWLFLPNVLRLSKTASDLDRGFVVESPAQLEERNEVSSYLCWIFDHSIDAGDICVRTHD